MESLALIAFEPLVFREVSLEQDQKADSGCGLGLDLWMPEYSQQRFSTQGETCC